jgi:hypothetical protein
MMQCATGSDCPAGEQCHAIPDVCSASGVGSMCGPPCTTDCSAGFRCNATHACEPVPCNEGFACATYQICASSTTNASKPVYDQTQGCTIVSCATDASCPQGTVCVDGVCQTGPGECEAPVEVP